MEIIWCGCRAELHEIAKRAGVAEGRKDNPGGQHPLNVIGCVSLAGSDCKDAKMQLGRFEVEVDQPYFRITGEQIWQPPQSTLRSWIMNCTSSLSHLTDWRVSNYFTTSQD